MEPEGVRGFREREPDRHDRAIEYIGRGSTSEETSFLAFRSGPLDSQIHAG